MFIEFKMVEQQKIDIAEEPTTKSTIEKKNTSGSTAEKQQDNAHCVGEKNLVVSCQLIFLHRF